MAGGGGWRGDWREGGTGQKGGWLNVGKRPAGKQKGLAGFVGSCRLDGRKRLVVGLVGRGRWAAGAKGGLEFSREAKLLKAGAAYEVRRGLPRHCASAVGHLAGGQLLMPERPYEVRRGLPRHCASAVRHLAGGQHLTSTATGLADRPLLDREGPGCCPAKAGQCKLTGPRP